MKIFLTICFSIAFTAAFAQDATLESWLRNTNNTSAQLYDKSGNVIDLEEPADVQKVQYSANFVYVSCSGLPSYKVGPFNDGNPSTPGNQGYTWKIPRIPVENTGTKTSPGLGAIGILINGIPLYNAEDAMTYNNGGIWHRDAIFFENDGFDCAKGHPSPNMQGGLDQGYYHHHQLPIAFSSSTIPNSDICTNFPSDALLTIESGVHSPIIGFSFDGFPIYGPYSYENTDGTGSIVLMESSYQKRNITERTTLADGTILKTSEHGPSVNAEYPLGAYIEDYEFVENSGHLDASNGRFCVTPEYPNGTYAYFATVDASLNSTYPYFIGPTYYGKVETANFTSRGKVSITETVVEYTGTTSFSETKAFNCQIQNMANSTWKIQLSENEDFNFAIYNLSGAKILEGVLNNQNQIIQLQNQVSGIYILQLKNAVHQASFKLYHID